MPLIYWFALFLLLANAICGMVFGTFAEDSIA
jgi:hypothetical protein